MRISTLFAILVHFACSNAALKGGSSGNSDNEGPADSSSPSETKGTEGSDSGAADSEDDPAAEPVQVIGTYLTFELLSEPVNGIPESSEFVGLAVTYKDKDGNVISDIASAVLKLKSGVEV